MQAAADKYSVQDAFQGSSVLITGATGYVGSLVLEQLLRVGNISKAYLLVRTKQGEDPQQRLKSLLASPIFRLHDCTQLSLHKFLSLYSRLGVDTVPAVWKIALKRRTGEVLMYGDPLPPHARTAGWFLMEIGEQLEDNLGRAVKKAFAYSAEEQGIIPSFGFKVPDFAIIAKSHQAVQATVVGEIGYHGEMNFETVKEEVDLWCRNRHSVVIGVKITDNTAVSTVQNPRLEVVVKILGKEDQEFHVGQGASHVCAEGKDVIHTSSELFLPTAQRIQMAAIEPIKLDLFCLLQDIRLFVMQRDTL